MAGVPGSATCEDGVPTADADSSFRARSKTESLPADEAARLDKVDGAFGESVLGSSPFPELFGVEAAGDGVSAA